MLLMYNGMKTQNVWVWIIKIKRNQNQLMKIIFYIIITLYKFNFQLYLNYLFIPNRYFLLGKLFQIIHTNFKPNGS